MFWEILLGFQYVGNMGRYGDFGSEAIRHGRLSPSLRAGLERQFHQITEKRSKVAKMVYGRVFLKPFFENTDFRPKNGPP